jgi:hypothetical protein
VLWLWQLVDGFSPWKSAFDLVSLRVRFVAEKVAMGQVLIRALRLHLPVILPQFSILFFNEMVFVPGEERERLVYGPAKQWSFRYCGSFERKRAFTLLRLGRVKGITRCIVLRLNECKIFAPYLKESRTPINAKLHSRFCKMSPSYA